MVFLGAAVSVKMTCNSGHDESWHSSRTVGQGRWTMPLINLVMIVYCFMTGLQFDRVSCWRQYISKYYWLHIFIRACYKGINRFRYTAPFGPTCLRGHVVLTCNEELVVWCLSGEIRNFDFCFKLRIRHMNFLFPPAPSIERYVRKKM